MVDTSQRLHEDVWWTSGFVVAPGFERVQTCQYPSRICYINTDTSHFVLLSRRHMASNLPTRVTLDTRYFFGSYRTTGLCPGLYLHLACQHARMHARTHTYARTRACAHTSTHPDSHRRAQTHTCMYACTQEAQKFPDSPNRPEYRPSDCGLHSSFFYLVLLLTCFAFCLILFCTHVCTYICTLAYTHVCMRVCTHLCTHVCTHGYMHRRMTAHMSARMFARISAHISVYC